jgi:TolB-like protein
MIRMRLLPLALVLVTSTASAAVPTVAVLPFRDLSGGKRAVGEAIRETVTTDLKQLGGVRVVERAQLDRVLGEQHLQGAAEIDPATAARVGKLLGASLIAVGAYQQVARDVRLTARFVRVETGEIVGSAKVDGRASDFFRLQDRVTGELLRSPGLGERARRIVGRARPALKSLHTLELYGNAVVADNDQKKERLLELAVAEDAGFTYAAADLAALEKRMNAYEQRARAKQEEKTRALLAAFAKEKDPHRQAAMALQVLTTLAQARRFRTLAALGRSLAAGPVGSEKLAGGQRLDELALFYVITAENSLRQRDAVLHDGEDFLRRFSASVYFNGVRSIMDNVIREKREVEEGKAKVQRELGELSGEQRWNLCRVATTYAFNHQYAAAQRLFHACFTVGGVDKNALPQLVSVDLALGDWAAIKKDLGALEKLDPELYRTMKVGYDAAIPSDI